jgi:Gram-negative bacterial TonB protein C-terminal
VVFRSVCVSLTGILLCAAVAPAVAAEMPLHPIEPWVLDYADAQCLAFRQYGTAQDPISLAIKPSPNGETYELLVGRTRRGPKYAEEVEGSVNFGDGPIKASLLHYGAAGKTTGEATSFHQFRISAADMARARAAKGVTFRMMGAESVSLTLESMAELLDGLARCNADLQDYWNLGGEKNGRIAVPPKGEVRRIFTADDYPAEALHQLQEGSSQFLLLVDEHGKVAGCHVEKASGIPIFDVMGCQVIVQRMTFAPALDGKGRPARSTYLTPPVTWRIGG